MNCRDFTIEFEERAPLSEKSVLHLKICSDCQKLSEQQRQIWRAIEDFRKVAAPADFDFRVRAGIAGAGKSSAPTRFFPALRYVLPLGLIVLLLGAAVFNFVNFSGGGANLPVAELAPPNSIKTENPPVVAAANNSSAAPAPSVSTFNDKASNENFAGETTRRPIISHQPQLTAANFSAAPRAGKSGAGKNNFDGGSRNLASTSAQTFTPRNLNANQSVNASPAAMSVNSLTYEQILFELGIETADEGDKIKISKVKEKSLAERSGIKVGDVLEEVDGNPVDKKASVKTIEIKKLTIVRDAKKMFIDLQN